MANGDIVRKERSQYLIKTQVDGSERIVINGTQVITPEGIANYIGRTAGGLTPEQKERLEGSVRFDKEQYLSEEDRRQARENIGADVFYVEFNPEESASGEEFTADKTFEEVLKAYRQGKIVCGLTNLMGMGTLRMNLEAAYPIENPAVFAFCENAIGYIMIWDNEARTISLGEQEAILLALQLEQNLSAEVGRAREAEDNLAKTIQGKQNKVPRVIVHRAIPQSARVGDIYYFADGNIKVRKEWEGKGYFKVTGKGAHCYVKIDENFHSTTGAWYGDALSDHSSDFEQYFQSIAVSVNDENRHTASPNFDIVDGRVVCVKPLPQIPNKFIVRNKGAHTPFVEYTLPRDTLIINKRVRAEYYSLSNQHWTRQSRIAFHKTRAAVLGGGIVSWVYARTRKGYVNPVGIKIVCAKRGRAIIGIRV